MSLSLHLLGNAALLRDGLSLEEIRSQKAKALFLFVACHPYPVARDRLTDLFFGDRPTDQAQSNIRTLLARLKPLAPYLLIERHTVGLNPLMDIRVDVLQFAETLAPLVRHGPLTSSIVQRLEETLALYQGEFLAGLHVPDALAWEEWLLVERERLLQLAIEGYHRLVEFTLESGDHKQGIRAARRLLALDPLREHAYRQLMTLYARDNQRLAALALYEQCRAILAEALGVDPSQETIKLHERILVLELPQGADDTMSAVRPHNLMRQLTPFIGREEEQRQITKYLTQTDTRLVSVVGAGGMGKSRVALQVAWSLATSTESIFPHGVFWVPLASVETTANVTLAIADTVGLELQGKSPPKAQLQAFVRDKTLLLVLDNLEQVLVSAEALVELLQMASGVKILTTSREPLNVKPELVTTLEGLPCPADLHTLEVNDACNLFLQHIRRLAPDFLLQAHERPALFRLCHLLAGMPLGLELAARWAAHLSITELVTELEQDLDVLTVSLRDLPERHRSIRAVFEQSWRRLTEQEQLVFAKLSLFRGGFSRYTARRVADATLPLLVSLEQKSLLRRDTYGRYDLHELLRQFALEKLEAFGETDSPQNRHTLFFSQMVHSHEKQLRGREVGIALENLRAELENIRVAWQYAVSMRNEMVIAQMMEGIARFYMIRSWYREGAELLTMATQVVAPHVKSSLETQTLYGQLLAWQGKILEVVAVEQAKICFGNALRYLEGSDSPSTTALSLTGLGYIEQVHGNFEQAEAYLAQALGLYQTNGDRYGEAVVLNHLCQTLYRQGMLERAKPLGEHSVAIRRDLGDILGLSASLVILGLVLCQRGEYDDGHLAFTEALAIYKTLTMKVGMANALNGLVQVAFAQQDIAQAKAYVRESLALYQEAGDTWGMGLALNNIGYLANEQKEYQEAGEALEQAIALFRTHQIPSGLTGALRNLGNTYRDQAQWQRALQYYRESLEVASAMKATSYMLQVLVHYARLLWLKEASPFSVHLLEFAHSHPSLRHDDRQRATSWMQEQRESLQKVPMGFNSSRGLNLEQIVQGVLQSITPHSTG